jgi:hypothetical protein
LKDPGGIAEVALGDGWLWDGRRVLPMEITGRHAVVAVKLDIIEARSNAIPAGHGGGFRSANMGHGSHDDVSEAHGFAYQHDFQFDRRANSQ